MSTPIPAEDLIRGLEEWNIPYELVPGWKTRGRDSSTGLKFGPVFGCGVHHTGSDGPDDNNRDLVIQGRADLPGPLAQFGGNDNGTIDVISINRCNHFGGGDPQVLGAVKRESYGNYPPLPNEHQGSDGAIDGNDAFYGIENYYAGSKPISKALYKSNIRLWAMICTYHGWSAKRVIGHKEWSDWKSDPGRVDMKIYRSDVQRLISRGPKVGATEEGPKLLTPHITNALEKNIKYNKALKDVLNPALQNDVDKAIHILRAQRRALRGEERK